MAWQRIFWVSLTLCLLASGAMAEPRAAPQPGRIVSLNLCTDILLLDLADRAQIASVSYIAADPHLSPVAGKAEGFALNHAGAEEVRLMEPDLVLAANFGTGAAPTFFGAAFTTQILKERGYHVVPIAVPMTLDAIAPAIEAVAGAIGQSGRGAQLAKNVRAELAAFKASIPQQHPSAVVFQPRGYAAGRPGLADDVLTLAGARNLAGDMKIADWLPLGVEGLLTLNPDFVVLDDANGESPTLSQGILKHRALQVFESEGRIVRAQGNLWSCATPETLASIAPLRAAIAKFGGGHAN